VNCPEGGLAVLTGLDQDEDGILDDGEVASTSYVCNGQGQDGHSTLIDTADEPPGPNCPAGGFIVSSGLDLDDDGILDPEEVTSTEYLCNGQTGQDGHSTLISTAEEPPGPNCPAGGFIVSSGLDLDGNGVLEPEEVTATEYVCNGEDGQDGLGSLVSVMDEAAGANCPSGGQAVRSGVDTNRDGLLQPEEVTSTDYVCNGAAGADGQPGLTSLVRQEDAAPGDCPFEGRVVMTGLDEDRDGYLDDAEVMATSYVCNGEPGAPAHASLFELLDEPAGANCPTGGTQVQTGLDTNDDGVLDPGEITQARYLCNGSDGADGLDSLVAVSDEAAGGGCGVVAGKKVETGLDNNGDGVLDPGEVDSTSFVCNGEDGIGVTNSLVSVTTEPAGAACPTGGQRVEIGLDDNGNTILEPAEIDTTSYVCNGLNTVLRFSNAEWGGVCQRGGVKVETGVDDDADGILDDPEVDQTQYVCNLFIVQISCRAYLTCALVSDGTGRCWGVNDHGQVGDGSTVDRWSPAPVSGLTQAVEVSAGGTHGCARLADGTARCWGMNEAGQLGDGTTVDSPIPVAVSGLSQASEVSAGFCHSCARLPTGTAFCWGNNAHGQLGDGTMTDRLTPVEVGGLVEVIRIQAGSFYSCAILADGTARCWGRNHAGQLGDGTTNSRSMPVVVTGLTQVAGISLGFSHTCAYLSDGSARCWGDNTNGQLGDGTTTNSYTPVVVSFLSQVIGVSAGTGHSCAVLTDGTALCWGHNNYGQLGDGTTIGRRRPVVVSEIFGVTGLSLANSYTCATTSERTRCWGNNLHGQLGDGTTNNRLLPTPIIWELAP